MENTISLIERVKKGDKAAFDELYKLHYPALRAYAGTLLRSDEAEDVVQDVFLNVWLRKDGLEDSLSFKGYLFRSVYNMALNVFKHKGYSEGYRSACEKEIEEMGYNYYDPDTCDVIRRLYNQDMCSDINEAIKSLSPKCRQVFSMSYLHDIPSKEISRVLGISLSTVNNHIYSALKQLRKKLIQYKGNDVLFLLLCLIK